MVVVSCMFALLCYEVVEKFFSDQKLIKMAKRQYKVNEIPFPAITFCPDMLIVGHNISPSFELHEMLGFNGFEEKLLDDIKSDSYQQFYEDFNFSAEALVPELRRRAQLEWFTQCVRISWMNQYSITVNMLLTKHGFCFSFNMHPIETLLRFDK